MNLNLLIFNLLIFLSVTSGAFCQEELLQQKAHDALRITSILSSQSRLFVIPILMHSGSRKPASDCLCTGGFIV